MKSENILFITVSIFIEVGDKEKCFVQCDKAGIKIRKMGEGDVDMNKRE